MDINQPIGKDITIRMNIFARDKKSRVYKLFFHSEKDIESSRVMDYCDRLEKGDSIKEKVSQALSEDLGLKKIKQLEVMPKKDSGLNTDELDLGSDILSEMNKLIDEMIDLAIEVKYVEDLDSNLGDDLFVTWIELAEEEEA